MARPRKTTSHIVPFGKYKDRPIEDLVADNAYVDWMYFETDVWKWLWRYQHAARLAARTDPGWTVPHDAVVRSDLRRQAHLRSATDP